MRLPVVEVMVDCLGFLAIGTLVGAWPIPQYPLLLPGPLPVATMPQIITYETEQGLDGYSFNYELTDGTARREEGNLENGNWIVFWGAEWMDDSRTTFKIVSDQTGVSWSINGATAVAPFAFVPMKPPTVPTTTRPPTGGVPFSAPFQPGFEIDLKKDQDPFFIQGCRDVFDKKGKVKGISCLAKASLAGGSSLNYLKLSKSAKS